MFCIGIHEQLLEHLTSQPVLRQHAFHRSFDNGFRTAGKEILRSFSLLSSGISGECQVFLFLQLVSCKFYLVCIDNNNKVTGIAFDVPNDDFWFEELNGKKVK